MLKKLFLLTFSSLLVFNLAQAQTKQGDTTKTVIVFNNSSTKSAVSRSNEDNIVKLAPLGIISGRIPVFYERKITDFLGIQLGAGLTTKNYIRLNIDEPNFSETSGSYKIKSTPLPEGVTDIAEELYKYNYRTAKAGYLFNVQPRVYFDSNGLEGYYAGLALEYYLYNYEIPAMVASGSEYKHTGKTVSEFESYKDLMIYFGYQRIYDNLTLDYGFGAGIRNLKGEKYVAGTNNNKFYDGLSKYERNAVVFNVSLKIGYHF